jgi:protein SCO1
MRLVLAIALAGLLLAGCESKEPTFKATDITGAELGRELQLTDHNGSPRTLADFRGKVLVVFFGFTHCPDVCPTTLAELARARKLLGADGERVQVVMVTVDPERDTPEVLREYVTALDPTFLGLTGDAQAIARTAREFKIFYQKSPGGSPQTYSVDHSSGTFVFDPAGRVRLLVGYGQGAEVFAHDVRQLLRQASPGARR